MTTKEQIFQACQPVSVPFTLAAWGGELRAAGLDGESYEKAEKEATRYAAGSNVRRMAWWCVRCVQTPDGQPLFADADVDRVARMAPGILVAAYQHVQEANGMDDELRAYRGNSGTAP